jgi:hypothetical protein
MANSNRVNVARLVAIPAVITLLVTILRVVGELKHWSPVFFNTAAGGGGAVVGIAWLPIIFGPYFAMKLIDAGEGPSSAGRAIGYGVGGLVVFAIGAAIAGSSLKHPSPLTFVGFLITLGAAFVPPMGWRSLGRALLDYALAARIPVLVVMFFAMSGNGGMGWGTHYDAVPPSFATQAWTTRFIFLAVMPQMTLWIGYTSVLGSICGGIAAAVTKKGKGTAPAAA